MIFFDLSYRILAKPRQRRGELRLPQETGCWPHMAAAKTKDQTISEFSRGTLSAAIEV
jgi:hypothetical protein